MTLNGGTFETKATFALARAVTLGGGGFSPNGGTTLTLSGVLSGGGGLTLNGAGTLILSDAGNTYTGGDTDRERHLERGRGHRPRRRGEHGDAERWGARDDGDVHVGADHDAGRGGVQPRAQRRR